MDAPSLRAAIDIGTNSVLLMVARVTDGGLERIDDRATITRLGHGVDRSGRLDPAAIARTLDALRGYATRIQELRVEIVRVVATSAVRDAANREDFLAPARAILGTAVETIVGEREALLTFRGALHGLLLPPGARVMTFDIGGGSTEIIVGAAGSRAGHPPDFVRSLDVGAVRLTERFVRHDPPAPTELVDVRRAAEGALADLGPPAPHDVLVGLAGTVTTLAAMHFNVVPYEHARIHGTTLSRDAVGSLFQTLVGKTRDLRERLPALDPRRADVIIAGTILVLAVMDRVSAGEIVVSDGGVRVGLLLESPRK